MTHSIAETDDDTARNPILRDQDRRDKRALSLLKKGSVHWNKAWQENQFPFDDEEYYPNFDGQKFEDVDFDGLGYFHASCRNASFVNCSMTGSDFESVYFDGSSFRGVVAYDSCFASAHFDGCKLAESIFEGCDMEDLWMRNAELRGVSLRHCNLDEAGFDDSLLEDVNLEFSHGRWATFNGARMFAMNLAGVKLEDCSFRNAHLPGRPGYMGRTSFELSDEHEDEDEIASGSDLSGSTFFDGGLDNLNFRESDLTNTGFYWCNLSGSDLRDCKGIWAGAFIGSDLAGSKLPNDNIFAPALNRVEKITALARPAYLANLITCGSPIAVSLFADRSGPISLPLFQVQVELNNFVLFGLLQSTIIGIYVSIYLVRAWETVASLPTIFPDGSRSPEVISPWSALVPAWLHLRVISEHRRFSPPRAFYLQFVFALGSHWLLTPLTAGAIGIALWHSEPLVRLPSLLMAALSLGVAAAFYRTGVHTLRGTEMRRRAVETNYETWWRRTRFIRFLRRLKILRLRR